MDLGRQIREMALNLGASLVGIAPVERFKGAPAGHHPEDFISEAKSVICIGIKILTASIEWDRLLLNSELVPEGARKAILQEYFYVYTGYDLINYMLDTAALRIGNTLEDLKFKTIAIPSTYSKVYRHLQDMIPGKYGLFSHRHAAVRAGLGEFGLNNIVVTPEYGSRVRFASIITSVELEPNEVLKEKVCTGESCGLCINECPAHAISIVPDSDMKSFYYNPVTRTKVDTCFESQVPLYCRGKCIRVCPVGRNV